MSKSFTGRGAVAQLVEGPSKVSGKKSLQHHLLQKEVRYLGISCGEKVFHNFSTTFVSPSHEWSLLLFPLRTCRRRASKEKKGKVIERFLTSLMLLFQIKKDLMLRNKLGAESLRENKCTEKILTLCPTDDRLIHACYYVVLSYTDIEAVRIEPGTCWS